MKRSTFLPSLLMLSLPGLASAQDGGRTAFEKACAQCHTVSPPAQSSARKAMKSNLRDEPVRGPDLGELVPKRSPEKLRAWIEAPNSVRKEARCDTRLLADGDLELVLGYLAISTQPPPPPREELLRQQLKKDLAERRAQKQRKAHNPSRPSQGKQ
ncbi:hypothetical protein ACLESO_39725 [Pyxidicoccus sp. 3LG]